MISATLHHPTVTTFERLEDTVFEAFVWEVITLALPIAGSPCTREAIVVEIENVDVEGGEELMVVVANAGIDRVSQQLLLSSRSGDHWTRHLPDVEVKESLLQVTSTVHVVPAIVMKIVELQELKNPKFLSKLSKMAGPLLANRCRKRDYCGLGLWVSLCEGRRDITLLQVWKGDTSHLSGASNVEVVDIATGGEFGVIVAAGSPTNLWSRDDASLERALETDYPKLASKVLPHSRQSSIRKGDGLVFLDKIADDVGQIF